MNPKGNFMSVTETTTIALLLTGSASLYLLLHAAIDLLRHGRNPRNRGSNR